MASIDKFTTYTNTTDGTLQASIREDLSDVISNIDPADTPLMSMIASAQARSTVHEWLVDSLEDASTTAAVEGAAFNHSVTKKPVRMSNYTAIFRRDFEVTDTMRAVENAGMTDAFAYQLDKSMRELGRNTEKALLSSTAAEAGDNTSTPDAREMAGLGAFVPDGTYSDNAVPDPTITPKPYSDPLGLDADHSVAAASGEITEDKFVEVLEAIWNQGGRADTVLANAAGKKDITAFNQQNTIRRNLDGPQDTIRNSIMYYESDFGEVAIVLSRHNPTGVCYAFQRDMLAKAFLQPTAAEEMARTTDSQPGVVKHELTLVCRNPYTVGQWTGVS